MTEETGSGGTAGRPLALAAVADALVALAAGRDAPLFALSCSESVELLDGCESLERLLDYIRLCLIRHLDVNKVGQPDTTQELIVDRCLTHEDLAARRVRMAEALAGPLAATARSFAWSRSPSRARTATSGWR